MPTAEGPAACFLVGLRSGVNACVDTDGKWRGDYVPAYLRRHPFILGEVEGSDPLVCVDQKFVSDSGEALFDGEGKESPILLDFIRLTNEYFASSKRTENFAKTLQKLNLLRSVNIDAKFESGETLALYGCLTIEIGRAHV